MSNELATVNSNPTQLCSTVSVETVQDKTRALRTINASRSLNGLGVGVAFDVCDIFQTPGVRRSRDPRIPDVECINTYFICPDGTSYMTQSQGIANSVAQILSPFMFPDCGKSTDKGYLTLCVVEQKLDNGNSIKSVVPID